MASSSYVFMGFFSQEETELASPESSLVGMRQVICQSFLPTIAVTGQILFNVDSEAEFNI